MNKFADSGMVLVTYYQINDKTTVDKGLGTVQQWLGSNSPVRFNKIEKFPIGIPAPATVTDGEEVPNVLDISSSFQIIIYPGTISPMSNDMFIIEHLKMLMVYRISDISYDTPTIHGTYQATARLEYTTQDDLDNLERQVSNVSVCKLEDFGTEVSPIISKDDFVYSRKLEAVKDELIEMYKAAYYNQQYDCFLASTNEGYLYDECLAQFITKHSLLNSKASPIVVMCSGRVREPKLASCYSKSIYHWFETDAPLKYLTDFSYITVRASGYPESIFHLYMNDDVRCAWPYNYNTDLDMAHIIDSRMFEMLHGRSEPQNAFERVLRMFARGEITSPQSIPLNIIEPLLDGSGSLECFFFTPIIIYIINKSLQMR
jgi:hypothetical protein